MASWINTKCLFGIDTKFSLSLQVELIIDFNHSWWEVGNRFVGYIRLIRVMKWVMLQKTVSCRVILNYQSEGASCFSRHVTTVENISLSHTMEVPPWSYILNQTSYVSTVHWCVRSKYAVTMKKIACNVWL